MDMQRSSRDGLVSGLILGVLIAFGFALFIRLIPAFMLVELVPRIILYLIQVPAALVFVLIAKGVAQIRSESPRLVLLWATAGAMTFDGFMLGFWPALYGQEGTALAIMSALLLWAFAWIVAAALLVAPVTNPKA